MANWKKIITDADVGVSGGVADYSHTHSYLPLIGGTLTGALTGTTGTFTTLYGDGSNLTNLPSGGASNINGLSDGYYDG